MNPQATHLESHLKKAFSDETLSADSEASLQLKLDASQADVDNLTREIRKQKMTIRELEILLDSAKARLEKVKSKMGSSALDNTIIK